MGFRDLVLWVVGALLVYLAWLLIRLLASFRRKKPLILREPSSSVPIDEANSTLQTRIVGNSLGKAYSSDVFDGGSGGEEVEDLPVMRQEPPPRRIPVPPEPDAGRFGFEALLELRTTRNLVDELQHQQASLREEVEEMRRELAELRAAAQVSPFYGEAGALARRGYDAQTIAERCGISVAEAEMVCSLSKASRQEED